MYKTNVFAVLASKVVVPGLLLKTKCSLMSEQKARKEIQY